MSKRIAPNFIEELKDRVDIIDVVNSRVPLKKAGKDYQACCPFHNEKTPSFTVSAQKQFYYCFGCGAKGNALNFVMEFDNLGFVDAVEKLSEENGITVEYEQLSKSTVEKIERQKTLYDYLDEAARLYETNLFHQNIGGQAQAYLGERQVDKETAEYFRLGYSQAGNYLQSQLGKNIDPQELQKAGLLGRGDNERFYDFFRDRLMFPIRDARGRVVGFGARALGDAKPKYLNTGDTELFNKSNTLYGLYEELQTNRNIEHLIVVEGYMDVIALHQMGVHGAVAALGTAFTQGHLNLIRKYTKKIFICFDGDNAGKKAARRAVELILPAMTVDTKIKMVFLPDGEDPDTLVRKIGKTAFGEVLEDGQYFSHFVCETIIGEGDLEHFEERGEMASRARALLDLIPEGTLKNSLCEELTRHAGGYDLYQLAADVKSVEHEPVKPRPVITQRPAQMSHKTAESRLIRLLLASPKFASYVEHVTLLCGDGVSDRELLYRLIQYFQFNPVDERVDESTRLHIILSSFNDKQAERLVQIFQSETFAELPNESLESRNQLLLREFIARAEKLLSELQYKNCVNT